MRSTVIFPGIDGEGALNTPELFEKYEQSVEALNAIDARSGDASTLLRESRQLFEDQDSRAQHIDSRAMAMVGHSGLIGSIAFGLIAWTSRSLASDAPILWIAIAILGVSLAYLAWGLMAAFEVIGRHVAAAIDPSDLPKDANAGSYDLQLAKRTLGYLIHNYKTNNRKAALVLAAQERIRNGLVLFVVGAVLAIGGQLSSGRSDSPVLGAHALELGTLLPELRREFGDSLVAADEATAARFSERGVTVSALPRMTVAGMPFEVLLLVDSATDRLLEVRFESARAPTDAASFLALEAALVRQYGAPEGSLTRSEPHPIRVWLLASKTVWAEDRLAVGGDRTTPQTRFVVGFRVREVWDPQ